jgi:MerR family transcriptional regulator, heat shock protein HspR
MAEDVKSTEASETDDPGGPSHVPEPSQGVYGIGVTAHLTGTGVQNLRAYERAGLLDPSRTAGGTRLYSPDDVARLLRIRALLGQGINLAGVARVLELEDDNTQLRDQLDDQRRSDPTGS